MNSDSVGGDVFKQGTQRIWLLLASIFALISVFVFVYVVYSAATGGGYSCKDSVDNLVNEYASQDSALEETSVIVVYGDSRTGHDIHQNLVSRISDVFPDAVFHTGDLVNSGDNEEDWAIFNSITSGLRESVDFYPAIGNHEGDGERFVEEFDLPNNERWYSVEVGEAYFIVLDTTVDVSQASEQFAWLRQELGEVAAETESIFAVFHHPVFNTGTHAEDEMNLRESVVPLFEEYGVDIVFSGHDHAYERSLYDGVYYIVSGGGGGPLYDQTRESEYSQKFASEYHYCVLEVVGGGVDMKVYDEEGNLLDSVSLTTDD